MCMLQRIKNILELYIMKQTYSILQFIGAKFNFYLEQGNTCELQLPLPMVTIMTSGKIWPGKLNCVKEFMIVPNAKNFSENFRLGVETYHDLHTLLKTKNVILSLSYYSQALNIFIFLFL